MLTIHRVLVPTDFSECSDQALNHAKAICEKFDSELHLHHVRESFVSGTPQFAMGLALPQLAEEPAEQVIEHLNKLVDSADLNADRVIVNTSSGSPFVEIIKYAKDQDVDLIILGTHGRTGLSHVFLGSVAENVVRHSPCPVLTVRSDDHQFVEP